MSGSVRPPSRRWIPAAAGLLAIPVLVGALLFGLSRTGEPELLEPAPNPGPVTIAGSLSIEPKLPVAGQLVSARALISADRPVRLKTLVVKVQDDLGAFHDFPASADHQLGTTEQEFTVTRTFARPGFYEYYLAYETESGWTSLPPWRILTIR